MGLFDKIFGRQPKPRGQDNGFFQTLNAYTPVFQNYAGSIYEATLIRAAVDARARHISKLKFEIIGKAQPRLRTRLTKAPNDWMTWGQFLYRLSTILDLQTTAFIVPVFDDYEDVNGYYPVLPSSASVQDYGGNAWLRYRFSNGQEAAVELSRCGVMTRFQYDDDFFGSGNGALKDTMDLIALQGQAIKEAAKNSNSYRLMARLNNFTNAEDLAKERKRFNKQNFQDEDGGGLLLFPNQYTDIRQLTITPYTVDEAQAKEIRTNVYDYFGVNEDVLQNKAYGDAWQGFYEGAIEPFAIQFSDVMTKAIYTPIERGNGNQIMLTANRLQYMSTKEKLNIASQMTDRGIFSINEAREIFNLAPVDGGDVRTIRGEYKNADDVAKENGGENEDSD